MKIKNKRIVTILGLIVFITAWVLFFKWVNPRVDTQEQEGTKVTHEQEEMTVTPGADLNELGATPSISSTTIYLAVGEKRTIAINNPVSGHTYSWTISDSSIASQGASTATSSSNVRDVTGLKIGHTRILTGDGTGGSYQCEIYVCAKVTLDDQGGTGGDGYLYANTTYKASSSSGIPYAKKGTYANLCSGTNLSLPTRMGYTFKGYYTQPNGQGTQMIFAGGVVNGTTGLIPSSDTTWYAHWESSTGGGSSSTAVQTVTLNSSGADTQGTDKIYIKNNELYSDSSCTTVFGDKINMPSRAGYTFKGYTYTGKADPINELGMVATLRWDVTNLRASGTNKYPATGDFTIYAKWEKVSIRDLGLSYEKDRIAIGETTSPKLVVVPSDVSAVNVSWSSSNTSVATVDASGIVTGRAAGTTVITVQSNDDSSVKAQAAVTVAETTYTISYNANGGSGAPSSQTKTKGTTLTLSSTKPTRSGYNFLGWSTSSSATSATYNAGGSYTTDGDATLYAVWEVATASYTVKHQKQRLDGSYEDTETEPKTGNIGDSVTPDVKSYTGFTSPSTQTATIARDGSTTITYQYARNKYNFSLGSASGVSTAGSTESGSYYYEQSITLKATVNDGYTWKQWTGSTSDFTTTDANKTITMPAADLSMVPEATANSYKVTYNLNGGENGPDATTALCDSDVTVDFSKIPTKTGYTFKGYATTETETTATYTKDGTMTFKMGPNDITLYAVWEANQYTIEYNGNKATSGKMEKSTHIYDKEAKLSKNAYLKTGYTFIGWSDKEKGEVKYKNEEAVKNLTTETSGKVVLYAVWEANGYKIEYNGNKATSGKMEDSTHVYDVEKKLSKNTYKKTGYTFTGWAEKENGEVKYKDEQAIKNLATEAAKKITLYAVWKDISEPIINKIEQNGETVYIEASDIESGIAKITVNGKDITSQKTSDGKYWFKAEAGVNYEVTVTDKAGNIVTKQYKAPSSSSAGSSSSGSGSSSSGGSSSDKGSSSSGGSSSTKGGSSDKSNSNNSNTNNTTNRSQQANTTDANLANKILPKTGLQKGLAIAILASIGLAIFSIIKYRKLQLK